MVPAKSTLVLNATLAFGRWGLAIGLCAPRMAPTKPMLDERGAVNELPLTAARRIVQASDLRECAPNPKADTPSKPMKS
jgi:hypothetical protein